jgi:hypothetical protein
MAGRRPISGRYGRAIPQTEHGIPDSELMTGGAYAKYKRATRQRVADNFRQKRIDRLLNSEGVGCYCPRVTDSQWAEIPAEDSPAPAPSSRAPKIRAVPSLPDPSSLAFSSSPPDSAEEPAEEPGELGGSAPGRPPIRPAQILGQAKTKGAIHSAQLSELKVAQARGVLVNRAAAASRLAGAAMVTRDRLLAIPDYVAEELIAVALETADPRARSIAVKARLRAAISSALVQISEDGIAGLL